MMNFVLLSCILLKEYIKSKNMLSIGYPIKNNDINSIAGKTKVLKLFYTYETVSVIPTS